MLKGWWFQWWFCVRAGLVLGRVVSDLGGRILKELTVVKRLESWSFV